MVTERWIRLIAGSFVLVSLALGYWLSPWFLLFTGFVGLNLFQSALTRWCLMEDILVKVFGMERCADLVRRQTQQPEAPDANASTGSRQH